MGQSIGRLISFNSGNKPSLMLKYENTSVATEYKELCRKPSLDVQIIQKSQFVSEKMETFITDTIIMARLRHYEDSNQMMSAVRQKLKEYYWGNWNIIFQKAGSKEEFVVKQHFLSGYWLKAKYDGFNFFVFKSPTMGGIWPKLENEVFCEKDEKFQQDELGVKIVFKQFGMFASKTSFFTDAIILAKLRQPEDLNKMALSIHEKAKEKYGGYWNVIINTKCAFDLEFQVETAQGTYIKADYDGLRFYIFQSP